jgi:lysine-specific metallo-endopeptidase family protein
MLEAKLVTPDRSFKSQHSVPLKLVLTNTGDTDLSVLTRDTPLDDIITDCLNVTVNGKKVEYDGPLVKRAPPTAKEYVTIKAGETVETKFPVSDAYDTSKPGTYEVKLKTPIPDVRPMQPGLAAAMRSSGFAPKVRKIKAKTSFKVAKGAGKRLTLGEAARVAEAAQKKKVKAAPTKAATAGFRSAIKKKAAAVNAPLDPVVSGGSATKKAAARKAHKNGYKLCVNALAGLQNNTQYVEWLGAHTATRFKKVKKNFTTVKDFMESKQFTYDCSGDGCGTGVYAYTYWGTTTIWFCSEFWAAPTTGSNSKAGTVLHEHTHSDALTDDIAYGEDDCRALAISSPSKAIKNADSHEYYAGG